jgi:hypothetical protein
MSTEGVQAHQVLLMMRREWVLHLQLQVCLHLPAAHLAQQQCHAIGCVLPALETGACCAVLTPATVLLADTVIDSY